MLRSCLAVLLLGHALAAAAPSVRVLAWDQSVAARELALTCGESVVEIVDMHPEKRTATFRLKGYGPVLLRALDRKDTEGKPFERACAIPETVTRPLLVLIPDKADPTGLRVFVFNDDPAGFTWGSYRFLNATSKDLVVKLEEKAVKLPADWKPVDLNLGGDTRGVGVMVALVDKLDKPIYSAVWEYNTGVRTICFIVTSTDPRLGVLNMKAIPEDKRTLELEEKAGLTPAAAKPPS